MREIEDKDDGPDIEIELGKNAAQLSVGAVAFMGLTFLATVTLYFAVSRVADELHQISRSIEVYVEHQLTKEWS